MNLIKRNLKIILTSTTHVAIPVRLGAQEADIRGRETITYLFRLVLLHANCVKKPHRSSAMVTFFAPACSLARWQAGC